MPTNIDTIEYKDNQNQSHVLQPSIIYIYNIYIINFISLDANESYTKKNVTVLRFLDTFLVYGDLVSMLE